jgi:hypothetical protein
MSRSIEPNALVLPHLDDFVLDAAVSASNGLRKDRGHVHPLLIRSGSYPSVVSGDEIAHDSGGILHRRLAECPAAQRESSEVHGGFLIGGARTPWDYSQVPCSPTNLRRCRVLTESWSPMRL